MVDQTIIAFIGLLSTLTADVRRILGPDADLTVWLSGLNTEQGVRLHCRILAGHDPATYQKGEATFSETELGQATDPAGLIRYRIESLAREVAQGGPRGA